MSELDKRALESNFEAWRKERGPSLPKDKAFERYSVEHVLRDFDLSDEEIESGIFGKGDDGGIDAFYFFVNRTLIQDETDIPNPAITVQLILVQAKYERGFAETAIQKMEAFARDLLDYSTPANKLAHLNSLARDAISRFRDGYDKIVGTPHSISVAFHYTTRSDQDPNHKVVTRAEKMKKFISEQLSAAAISLDFWGCAKLLKVARSSPHQHIAIEISRHFTTDDGAVVCLVNLKSYKAFVTTENGELRTNVLEPNVRDYQGKGNPVNSDIRSTLQNTEVKEFWWLNNGITVLGASCAIGGNKLTVERPEIVNGLQTSHEIFRYFKEHPSVPEVRNVLIRVIVPPDEQTRGKIIKATNFQTLVDPVSLHANEQIHFDIEDKLKLHGLFYDRRKGQYRRLRKPISNIISIRTLARTVIAALLRQPDYARARPTTLMRNDKTYLTIFNDAQNRDMYLATVLLDRQIEQFLEVDDTLRSDERRDVRYYILMFVVVVLSKNAKPTHDQIASLAEAAAKPLPKSILTSARNEVVDLYKKLGGTDVVAKGTDLRTGLQTLLDSRYPTSALKTHPKKSEKSTAI